MAVADRIRSLLNRKKPAQAEELGNQLAETRAAFDVAKLRAAKERELHPKHVLAGAADAARHRELLAQLDGEVLELGVLLALAEERQAKAIAEEAEAARLAKYEGAAKLAAEVGQELAAKYPELAAGLLHLLNRVTYANDAIRAANEDLPAGCSRLEQVETTVRDMADLPRTNLSERVVALWAYPDSKQPLSDDLQARISSRDGHVGHILPRANEWNHSAHPVVKKRFRRVEYHDAVMGRSGDRLANLKIPALRAQDLDLWTPDEFYRPTHVDTQRRLDDVTSGRRTWRDEDRPTLVEYIVIEDTAGGGAN